MFLPQCNQLSISVSRAKQCPVSGGKAGPCRRNLETSAATDALIAELRAVIADLRRYRDEWREQAQRLALPAPKPAEQLPTTAWQRFLRWRRATG